MATTGISASQAPIYRLDDGLLMQMFEECINETGKDLVPVLHLMTVCKSWSVLATPLLFRYLNLEIGAPNSSHLHGFARHARLRSMKGENACSRLRSIHLMLKTELTPEDVSDMAYILLNASNLQSLDSRGRAIPSLLLMASHGASSTLRSLTLCVRNDIISDVQHIGQLKHLQSLTIYSHANWSKAYVFWDMPSLEYLDWQGIPESVFVIHRCSGDVAFLNQCRFIGLKELKICLSWHGEPPPSQSTELIRLLAMTTAPKGRLEFATLFLMPNQASAVLPCARVPVLNLLHSPLSADIARHLHLRTGFLAISIMEVHVNGLWQFLDALHTQVRSDRSNLRYIKISSSLPALPKFTWGSQGAHMVAPSHDATSFVGRLLGFAMRLKVCGIDIIDEQGSGFDGAKVVLSPS